MSRRISAAIVAFACLLAPASAAAGDDEPSNERLILVGSLMAVPTYFVGVTVHEGSHALVAKLSGATITELKLWPGVDEASGRFYFGLTRYRGRLTRGQKTVFFLAPKIVDLVMLSGFALLVELDGLPSNEYGQLALTVFASGSWVDFSKDIFSRNPGNDMVKLYRLRGRDSEWERLPYRLLHAGLSAGAAYFLARSYVELFDGDDAADSAQVPMMFQLLSTRF